MGLIGYAFSYQAIFVLVVVLTLPVFVSLARIHATDIHFGRSCGAPHHHALEQPTRAGRTSLWKSPGLLVLALCLFLFQLGNASMLPLTGESLIYQGEGRSSLIVSALIVLPQIVVAALAPWVGREANNLGARKFNGKKAPITLALAGVLLWILACSIAPIYARAEFRATVMAAIAVFYTLLALLELWRGRGDGAWRWPIMLLLLGHAAAIPVRIPIAGAWFHPDPADVDLLTFMIFESAFVCICAAYLFGGLAKDRISASYRRISLTDSLTRVPNRRGLFETAERLLMRTRFARQPVAFLLFDLDCFKSINDKHGHQAGDEVLTALCRLATSVLRPTDLFGRIDGEEFASLLPGTEPQDALWLADRLRTAFEGASHTVGGRTLTATVSVGVAVSDDAGVDLSALQKEADQALYRAKALGRNRVEISGRSDERLPTEQRSVLFPAVQ
jgi:diguanylate cyclase (GGDEF)-like protein